ncbi:hypothetical protein JR316_0010108 [Psilocybe cubensis]|uniref:Uncharacterized protein n=2 Tax=Psilocybe cubensis TaxID=181762 RepID=A0ACB8GQE1_PSICU|nr:hypothetical protein JR316_0010108 [Psilocybe cubensis]KAH9477876.1 hypothetical protein JR316_0010108 [Psilocybe cubensis]
MSNNAAYGTWNPTGSKSSHSRHGPVERRTSDGEDQSSYSVPSYGMAESFIPPDLRPMSSTSSLTGAMGDASISNSRHSRSPSSSNSGNAYSGNLQTPNSGLWNTSSQMNMIAMNNSGYPGVAGHGGMGFSSMSQSSLDMSLNEYTTTRNVSPESISPHSPNYPSEYGGDAYRHHLSPQQGGAPMGYIGTYPSSPDSKSSEIASLRRRIKELEQECSRAKVALQAKTGLPAAPRSASFQASWRARTETRKKMFCSLNRAGNALCAWHDSRRERRAYPARHAPPGYLNCGCTYEEALFEESLSRHGVGSYLPGETVRMDPALRNPLLRLLEQRYGYKDGDFEHDPITETWFEGESPMAWEQKAQSGQVVKRRTDADRH